MTHRVEPWIEWPEYDYENEVNPLFDDEEIILNGLARQCPNCGIVSHFEVRGRKQCRVVCPLCDFNFIVQKYKRGERPKERVR